MTRQWFQPAQRKFLYDLWFDSVEKFVNLFVVIQTTTQTLSVFTWGVACDFSPQCFTW